MGNFVSGSSPVTADEKQYSGAQSNRVYSKRAGDMEEESDLEVNMEGEYHFR